VHVAVGSLGDRHATGTASTASIPSGSVRDGLRPAPDSPNLGCNSAGARASTASTLHRLVDSLDRLGHRLAPARQRRPRRGRRCVRERTEVRACTETSVTSSDVAQYSTKRTGPRRREPTKAGFAVSGREEDACSTGTYSGEGPTPGGVLRRCYSIVRIPRGPIERPSRLPSQALSDCHTFVHRWKGRRGPFPVSFRVRSSLLLVPHHPGRTPGPAVEGGRPCGGHCSPICPARSLRNPATDLASPGARRRPRAQPDPAHRCAAFDAGAAPGPLRGCSAMPPAGSATRTRRRGRPGSLAARLPATDRASPRGRPDGWSTVVRSPRHSTGCACVAGRSRSRRSRARPHRPRHRRCGCRPATRPVPRSMPSRRCRADRPRVLWARESRACLRRIAERFTLSEPTVRSLLHRARRTLRRGVRRRGAPCRGGIAILAPWRVPLGRSASCTRSAASPSRQRRSRLRRCR